MAVDSPQKLGLANKLQGTLVIWMNRNDPICFFDIQLCHECITPKKVHDVCSITCGQVSHVGGFSTDKVIYAPVTWV